MKLKILNCKCIAVNNNMTNKNTMNTMTAWCHCLDSCYDANSFIHHYFCVSGATVSTEKMVNNVWVYLQKKFLPLVCPKKYWERPSILDHNLRFSALEHYWVDTSVCVYRLKMYISMWWVNKLCYISITEYYLSMKRTNNCNDMGETEQK